MRVARAVEPNAGTRAKLKKRLITLTRKFRRYLLQELAEGLEMPLAMDASLINPQTPQEREKVREIYRRIDQAIKRDPQAFRANLEGFINKNLVKWLTYITKEGESIARWYATNCAYEISNAQRRAFIAAGINPQIFKERWQVPRIKTRYISPQAMAQLPDIVDQSTTLITKMGAGELQRFQDVFTETITKGGTMSELKAVLSTFKTFDEKRAARVALDQSLKVSYAIESANAQSLGITKAVWVHVAGQYTSRESHVAMHGKEFDLNVGLYDREVGFNVLPKQLPYCRCSCRYAIPADILGGAN